MKKELKCKELLLDENSEVEIISLVKKPAIQVDFMKFNETEILKFADNERQILTGPALIPDKMIYRRNEMTGEEYNVFFSAPTVDKIAQQYLQSHNQSNVNLEHDQMVEDTFLYESWIIEDPKNDKSNVLGFNLPKGTWMVSMKVNNPDVWNKVKSGEVAGFSIEGSLAMKMSMDQEVIDNELLTQIIDILESIDPE